MLGALAISLFLSWVQVSSETYIVKSSAGEDRAKRVLRELKHFHQLVGKDPNRPGVSAVIAAILWFCGLRGRAQRQLYNEGGSLLLTRAVRVHGAAVRLNKMPDDRKS